jgi:hypothetical protein
MTDAIDHFDEHDDVDEAANLSVRDKIKYFSGGGQNHHDEMQINHDEMQITDDEMIMTGNYEDQEVANDDDEMTDQANLSVRDKIQYFGGRNQSSNRSGIRQTKHQTLVPKPIEYGRSITIYNCSCSCFLKIYIVWLARTTKTKNN